MTVWIKSGCNLGGRLILRGPLFNRVSSGKDLIDNQTSDVMPIINIRVGKETLTNQIS